VKRPFLFLLDHVHIICYVPQTTNKSIVIV